MLLNHHRRGLEPFFAAETLVSPQNSDRHRRVQPNDNAVPLRSCSTHIIRTGPGPFTSMLAKAFVRASEQHLLLDHMCYLQRRHQSVRGAASKIRLPWGRLALSSRDRFWQLMCLQLSRRASALACLVPHGTKAGVAAAAHAAAATAVAVCNSMRFLW